MKNNNLKIQLVKEIYQGKEFTLPYREYDLIYFEENYSIIVNDTIIGNSAGKYEVKIYLKEFGKQELIYHYDFNGDIKPLKNEEIENEDYNDIIQYLLDNGIIKKITPSNDLL
jgi:hypothetical protein